jgi:hypothetical protein
MGLLACQPRGGSAPAIAVPREMKVNAPEFGIYRSGSGRPTVWDRVVVFQVPMARSLRGDLVRGWPVICAGPNGHGTTRDLYCIFTIRGSL